MNEIVKSGILPVKIAGTKLGLSLTCDIVNAHGCKISVLPAENKEMRFIILLPHNGIKTKTES